MPTPLDADQLRTFVAIVESGSFTRAAQEVSKTQSAVSMQMKRLEQRVGAQLFARDGRQNRLTREGERLLDHARRIVRLNREALEALAAPRLSGSVCFGIPDDYADRLLPGVLAAFARSHPQVELVVTCEGSVRLAQRIERGEVELAVVTKCELLGRPGRFLRQEALNWVASRSHAAQELDPVPLAVGPPTCIWRRAATEALDRSEQRYRIAYTSEYASALAPAVLAGLAISVFPDSAVRPGMRVLGEQEGFPTLPPCEIALLSGTGDGTPVARALAAHVIENLEQRPLAIAAE